MRCFLTRVLAVALAFHLNLPLIFGQDAEKKVFFLEDLEEKEWCSFGSEEIWKAAVHNAGSMRVGTLVYTKDHLSQIYFTEEAESGDWVVYDHYFLDDEGQLIKLSRTINILPEDRSSLQLFVISNSKVEKTQTTDKRLSTGVVLSAPDPIWLPELPIATNPKQLPFAALLGSQRIKSTGKNCVKEPPSR